MKEDRTGVVELSMPTSTNPILGNWTIQARILVHSYLEGSNSISLDAVERVKLLVLVI